MSLKNVIENYRLKRILRKMQYISDQQGIMKRYIREKIYWDAHFKNSKDFILKSAQTKGKGKVVVLGSGWLLDLPFNELYKQFKELVLIDIIHPKQIIRKAKGYPNVTLVNADITGGLIKYFYGNVKSGRKNKVKNILPSFKSFSFKLPNDSDFVISSNIMCQLHIILIDYIKRFSVYSNSELKKLEREIQQSHLNLLPKRKSCLITDSEEEIFDDNNNLLGINPLLRLELPQRNFSNKWQWKFDNSMTYRDDAKTFFNTIAIDF